MKNVTIYSTPTCHYCGMAKEYFAANDISYTEYNVASDADRRKEMMERSGQLGVPVILIGNDVVIGFNKPKLMRLLGLGDVPPVTMTA
jgi:glutaredoxin 3